MPDQDPWEEAAKAFKGTQGQTTAPESGSSAAPLSANEDWKLWSPQAPSQTPPRVGGQKVLDYANETISNVPSSAGKFLGNVGHAVMHPIDTAANIGKVVTGTAQRMTPGYVTPDRPGYSEESKAAESALKNRYGGMQQIADTVRTDPVGAAADAAAVAGGVSGIARGGAAMASQSPRLASTLGRIADTAGTVSDAINPITLPLKAVGAVPKAAAKGFVRSALPGLGGRTERYGATPATAVLEQTSGIKPSTLRASIRDRLTELNQQLDAVTLKAEQNGVTPELTKARQVLTDQIAKVKSNNGLTGDLDPMLEQLTEARSGFTGKTEYPSGAQTPINYQQAQSPVLGPNGKPVMGPPKAVASGAAPDPVVAAQQTPTKYLGMKRDFGNKFTKFDYAVPLSSDARSLGNRAYHELSSEFNEKVPGAAPINRDIQSLVPAEHAAQRADEAAGAVERGINRATRPTGGLAATLFGMHEAGIPGAVAAMSVQEALASPTVRMALARLLHTGGKVSSAPLTRRAINTLGVEGEAGAPDPRFNLR